MKRQSLFASFILFIALCASAAYWALQLFKPPQRPVAALQTPKTEIKLDAAAGLFGGRAATVAVAGNFQLKGVVVAHHTRDSAAILAADGKPARVFAVGAEVAPGVTVKEVTPQYVLLSEGGVTKRVELPENVRMQVKAELIPDAKQ